MSSTSRDNDLETSLDGSESTKSPRSGKKRINVVQISPLNLAKTNGSDSRKNNPSTSPRSARSNNISNSPRKKDTDRKLRVSIGPGNNEEIINGLNYHNGNLAAVPANTTGGSPVNGTHPSNCTTAVPAAVTKVDAASRRRSSSTPQKVAAQAKTPLSSSPVKPNMIPPINTASMTSPVAIPEVSSARRRNEIVSLKLSAIKKTDDDGLESSATPPSSRKHFTALALRNQDLDEVDLFDFFLQKEREFADNKDFVSPFRYIKSVRSLSQPPTPNNHSTSISSSTTPPDLEPKEEANHLEIDTNHATTIRFAPETFNTAQSGTEKPQETKRDRFPNFSDWAMHMSGMLRKKKDDLNPSTDNPAQRL
eukprot:TRINITY_DN3231_c0_g1_i1.p1 TRINITY_DN3231_c0_g1~~TRINITY_DN3231_c0_g1_i1.p1  ORF type:complete len:365 (-),score=11.36 TRINITY_DN3231_c0_g1_i1:219-1313(-)